jgi:hypothetical protein
VMLRSWRLVWTRSGMERRFHAVRLANGRPGRNCRTRRGCGPARAWIGQRALLWALLIAWSWTVVKAWTWAAEADTAVSSAVVKACIWAVVKAAI